MEIMAILDKDTEFWSHWRERYMEKEITKQIQSTYIVPNYAYVAWFVHTLE